MAVSGLARFELSDVSITWTTGNAGWVLLDDADAFAFGFRFGSGCGIASSSVAMLCVSGFIGA